MSIVLIGGNGFIGRHLCEELHHRRESVVTISYSSSGTFIKRFAPSIRTVEANSREVAPVLAEASVVVYLAHRSRPASNVGTPHLEIEGNVTEAARFFTGLAEVNPSCRIIYASSGGQIYGDKVSKPIIESDQAKPVTPYALGKLYAEQYLQFLERTVGIRFIVLRMGNPVGKWQLRGSHGFVAAAVKAALSNEELQIFGEGSNVRDYFDACDLALLIADLCSNDSAWGAIYNIGSGTGRTEMEVVTLVEQTLDCKLSIIQSPRRPFDVPYAVLNVTSAERELGWVSKTPLRESVLRIHAAILDPSIFE